MQKVNMQQFEKIRISSRYSKKRSRMVLIMKASGLTPGQISTRLQIKQTDVEDIYFLAGLRDQLLWKSLPCAAIRAFNKY
ncbi:hypothetical protein [Buttiauxella agrestis]|uniref:hypothetical protein n=1 Tax=Buttiauxella agrestis TaxID=82977 RepID=UPI0039758F37